MFWRSVIAVSIGILVGVGCSSSTPAGNEDTPSAAGERAETLAPAAVPVPKAERPAKKAPPAASAAQAPAAATAEKKTAVQVSSLLSNHSFEGWKDDKPSGWNIAEGADANWTEIPFVKSAEAHTGEFSLEIPAPANDAFQVIVARGIDPASVKSGADYAVTAAIKASDKDQVYLLLSYKKGDQQVKESKVHPGGNEWKRLQLALPLTADVDPASVRIQVVRNGGKPGVVLLDDVMVLPAKPDNT